MSQETPRLEIELDETNVNDAAADVERLLAHLETSKDPAERAKLLLAVGIAMRDDLGDADQALDAFLEGWKNDPTDSILDAMEPLARSTDRWAEVLEATRQAATTSDRQRAVLYSEALVR